MQCSRVFRNAIAYIRDRIFYINRIAVLHLDANAEADIRLASIWDGSCWEWEGTGCRNRLLGHCSDDTVVRLQVEGAGNSQYNSAIEATMEMKSKPYVMQYLCGATTCLMIKVIFMDGLCFITIMMVMLMMINNIISYKHTNITENWLSTRIDYLTLRISMNI